MLTGLTHTSLLVKDYDEALHWYTQKLGLELRSDSEFGSGNRWVTVGIVGQKDLEVVLYKPSSEQEENFVSLVGKQPGFVFSTDDCRTDVERLRAAGIKIKSEPEVVPWGIQSLFEDLYGNIHVLVEPPKVTN
ncbi:MAG: VOC family protein [Chroococcidiopsidaceae cyanobacterium CP_BM_ER_R8_30]|nr:VOC family protein [Chroococcidiopsidaceae cyanobacterium CP_BM_ER_R8_30]